MSEFTTFRENFFLNVNRSGNASSEDNGSDCEVDGSFIILPNNQSLPLTTSAAPGISLNVFQLGQQQSSFSENQQSQELSTIPASTSGSVTDITCDSKEADIGIGNNVDGTLNSVMSIMSSYNSTDSASACSLDDANSKVLQLLEKNRNLEVFVRELTEKQKRFLDECKTLQGAVEKNKADAKEQERKYDRSRHVIETLRTRIAELELECNRLKGNQSPKQSLDLSDKQVELRRAERELAEKDSFLQEANDQVIHLKDLLRKLENELNDVKASMLNMIEPTSLQNERDVLAGAFEESKVTIAKLTERLLAKDVELKKVYENTEALKTLHELTQGEYKQQQDDNTTLIRSCQHKTDEIKLLTEKWQMNDNALQQLEKQMNLREKDIQSLKDALEEVEVVSRQKIAVLESEIDDKEVFRTQMEEYKCNFEEERKDKVDIKERKDKLADELMRTQVQLEQKIAELEELHQTHLRLANEHINRAYSSLPSVATTHNNRPDPIGQVSRTFKFFKQQVFGIGENENGETPGSGPRTSDEFVLVSEGAAAIATVPTAPANGVTPVENEANYKCPICDKIFKTRDTLINHASGCGETRRAVPFGFP